MEPGVDLCEQLCGDWKITMARAVWSSTSILGIELRNQRIRLYQLNIGRTFGSGARLVLILGCQYYVSRMRWRVIYEVVLGRGRKCRRQWLLFI